MASDFQRQVDQWFQVRVMDMHRKGIAEKVVAPIHRGVVEINPKDTGRSASGWTTSFNGYSSRNPGTPSSQSAGVAASLSQLSGATSNLPRQIDYAIIQNHVPYTYYLNYGRNGRQWSFKAPLHYIEMVCERVARGLR